MTHITDRALASSTRPVGQAKIEKLRAMLARDGEREVLSRFRGHKSTLYRVIGGLGVYEGTHMLVDELLREPSAD